MVDYVFQLFMIGEIMTRLRDEVHGLALSTCFIGSRSLLGLLSLKSPDRQPGSISYVGTG